MAHYRAVFEETGDIIEWEAPHMTRAMFHHLIAWEYMDLLELPPMTPWRDAWRICRIYRDGAQVLTLMGGRVSYYTHDQFMFYAWAFGQVHKDTCFRRISREVVANRA